MAAASADQGDATTVNQYLAAGPIDELRLHIVPLTVGAATHLFEGVPPRISSRWSREQRVR